MTCLINSYFCEGVRNLVNFVPNDEYVDFDEYYERIKAIDEMQKSQLIQANIVKFE